MTCEERNDMLRALLQNYILEKRNNQVQMRENSIAYMHSLGMLKGACMALEYDIKEFANCISICSRKSGRIIIYMFTD